MPKMAPVVHFEMPANDLKRVADFYSKAFGWEMTQLGEDMGNYLMAATTETDSDHMIQTPGAINGGFYKKDQGVSADHPPHIVLAVDDIQEGIKSVKDNGGEVIGESMDIPGIGTYVSFKDTEGNIVGMLQPEPGQKVEV